MSTFYPILDITGPIESRVREGETMGTKRKIWLRNTTTGKRVLLKYAREGTGEDWSEKVAYELAELLGVPGPPRVEMATHEGEHAALSWDFLNRDQSLVHGNELLVQRDPSYPYDEFYRVPQHSVGTVENVLRAYGAPPSAPAERTWVDGFEVFIGYLLLDALIGNTDRHHQNWGIVSARAKSGPGRVGWLAPSYDHASSLGRELADTKRESRLTAKVGRGDLAGYAEKTKSGLFDSAGAKLAPIDAFSQAGALRPGACSWWLSRLVQVGVDPLTATISRVADSRLSPIGKRFATQLLTYNYVRLSQLRP